MSDIFQEVEEDLRRERLKRAWDRFGIYVIAAAVLIVVVTAGWRIYDAWQTGQARDTGTTFSAALSEAENAQTVSAAQALAEFADGAPAGYALLARFRAATAFAQSGEDTRASEIFAEIAADNSVDSLYRDLATLRLGQTQIDMGDTESARATLAAIAENSGNPFHAAAMEMMGLAAYAAGDNEDARRWFETVESAAGVGPGLQGRARFMLALIRQTSGSGDSPETVTGETN
ncbi:MAG: tetratricopeptide repeat protein [Pseudomonadota bacterium]